MSSPDAVHPSAAGPRSRLAIWPRRALYLVWAVAALAAGQALGWSTWQLLTALLPVLLVEALAGWYHRQAFPAFEQELMRRLEQGASTEELLALHRSRRLLRWASPRWALMAQLGLIHSSAGHSRLAADAYEDALEEAPRDRAFPLAVGLGDALHELGELAEAERVYRAAQRDHQHGLSSRACANLSRIILARGGDVREAEDYLRLAADTARDGVLRLELVHQLLAQGRRDDAIWELQKAEEELGDAPAARAALEQARSEVG